jgi:hypothetical protein
VTIKEMQNESQEWWKVWFLFLSNLSFFLTSFVAFSRFRYVQGAVYFVIPFTSGFYHLCKVDWIDNVGEGGFCFDYEFEELQKIDFFFASMTIPFAFFYLISFSPVDIRVKHKTKTFTQPPPLASSNDIMDINLVYNMKPSIESNERGVNINQHTNLYTSEILYDRDHIQTLLIFSYAVMLGFYLVKNDVSSILGVHLALSSISTVVIYTFYHYINYKLIPRFDYIFLVLGVSFSLLAISLMIIQDSVDGNIYWFTHSFWHIFGSMGHIFLLLSMKTTPLFLTTKYGLNKNYLSSCWICNKIVPCEAVFSYRDLIWYDKSGVELEYCVCSKFNDLSQVYSAHSDHRYRQVYEDSKSVFKIFDWMRFNKLRKTGSTAALQYD